MNGRKIPPIIVYAFKGKTWRYYYNSSRCVFVPRSRQDLNAELKLDGTSTFFFVWLRFVAALGDPHNTLTRALSEVEESVTANSPCRCMLRKYDANGLFPRTEFNHLKCLPGSVDYAFYDVVRPRASFLGGWSGRLPPPGGETAAETNRIT